MHGFYQKFPFDLFSGGSTERESFYSSYETYNAIWFEYPTFNKLAQKSSQNRLIGLFLHVFPHELNPLFTMFLLERCFGVFSENLRMKKVFYSSGPTPGLLLKFFGESIVNFLVS